MTLSSENWLGVSDSHIEAINKDQGLQPEVKQAFLAMQEQAKHAGLDLQIASSYRSFSKQLAIWQAKWSGLRPVYSLDNQPLDITQMDELQKIHSIMTWSALPGGSRHHWGTDMDVYDRQSCLANNSPLQLIPAEYQSGGPCFELNNWLEKHAEEFGFYRPYASYNNGVAPEPWHISYKPLAQNIIKQLDLTQLSKLLTDSQIGGKETILSCLNELFQQYTLNGETP